MPHCHPSEVLHCNYKGKIFLVQSSENASFCVVNLPQVVIHDARIMGVTLINRPRPGPKT